jgi:TRAP-type C4-dicarboxylate transport system substrate-binding protein
MDGTFFPDESVSSFKLTMVKHATTFPGGLYNTSFVFMMNPAKYNSLTADQKAAVDKISGESAARMFGEGWDKVDAASREVQKAQGVARIPADKAFVKAVADKQDYLETKWAASAMVKGLKDPKKVLAEFRAEIAKHK